LSSAIAKGIGLVVLFNYTLNFLHVLSVEGRLVLNNGYHRAAALLRRGQTILYSAKSGTSSKRWNCWTNKDAASCLCAVVILLRQSPMADSIPSPSRSILHFPDFLNILMNFKAHAL
jgi:hypothetical protein